MNPEGIHDWHLSPQARAIIARCQEGEFRVEVEWRSWCDANVFKGLTSKADAKLARLEVLRENAIERALGYTFAEVQQAKPWDETKARLYTLTDLATPEVSLVLRDEFAGRAVRGVAA